MSKLAIIESNQVTALDVFKPGAAERLVMDVEAEVSGLVFDVTTVKGRKEIASMAYKVAQSKTALDALGKELVSEWKAKSALVDADRKMLRDRLDALKEKVRLPLTEWEAAEAARLAQEKLDAEILAAHEQALKDDELFDRIKEVERKEAELKAAEEAKAAAERAEKERIEKADREKRIADEAAAAAVIKEQQRAALEAANQARAVADAKASEERAKREKEEALRLAEERRIKELKDAEERAKRESEQKEANRLREEAEAKAAEDKRAANKAHQKVVNQKALTGLVSAGLTEEQAKSVIIAVVSGNVPHMTVNY